MTYQATFLAVGSIFLLVMIGYVAKKIGILKQGDAGVVNSIILYITVPAFIFVNLHNKSLTPAIIKGPMVGFAMEVVVIGLAYLVGRLLKLDRPTRGALMLVAAFGNTAFLGYPVIFAAFNGDKQAMISAVMFDQFGMALALYSVGVAVASVMGGGTFKWSSMLGFLKSPLFPSTVFALIFSHVYVPRMLMDTLTYVSHATVPLAMLSIGLTLSTRTVLRYPLAFGCAIVLKMACFPFLVHLMLPVAGVSGIVAQVMTVSASLPCATLAAVVSREHGTNVEFASGVIVASTLLSLITIPAVVVMVH